MPYFIKSFIKSFKELMNVFIFVKFLSCFVLIFNFTGCVTANGPASLGNVEYRDTSAIETMDTKFGHTDLQMISEKITESLLQHPIFVNANYKDPVIIAFSHIVNNTNDRSFDTKAIGDKIKVALLKSGKARVTSFSNEQRDQHLRDEIINQQNFQQSGMVNKNTIGKKNNLYAADYFLSGEVMEIRKRTNGMEHVYTKMTVQLIDPESGLTIWADEKEIAKSGKRKTIGW